MKLNKHSHEGNSLYYSMEQLSVDLKSPLVNNTIQIPGSKGVGFIKDIFLEEGLCIRYYHFCLHDDLAFNWFIDSSTNEPIFKLVITLSASSKPGSEQRTTPASVTENSTILYSTDFVRNGTIPQNKWVSRIALLFTKIWLEDNFREASDKIGDIVNVLLTKNKPTFIAELMEQSHYAFVNELAKEMNKDAFPVIHIKTKSLILLNDFLSKIVYREKSHINANQSLYYTEITKIECRLRDYFDKPLPNIAELALEFNMSEATLKRHFKTVYGKSIYHYYLEKKLALGKAMIAAKNKSISEVAYTLGYNKINSFSKVFKKYYGVLPKDINSINSYY
jgi:AraC-like DNA-binding protein